jgi:hypothetical protein
MLRTRHRKLLLIAIAPLAAGLLIVATATILNAAAPPLRVNGSTTINPVVVEASNLLRAASAGRRSPWSRARWWTRIG